MPERITRTSSPDERVSRAALPRARVSGAGDQRGADQGLAVAPAAESEPCARASTAATSPIDDAEPTRARAAVALQSTLTARFGISVASGADQGATVVVDGTRPSRVYVGTGRTCDLRLSDPLISRRHLALEIVDQRMLVTDLGSTNGTTANGVSVREVLLRGGEIVRIGDTILVVSLVKSNFLAPITPVTRFELVVGASPEMRRIYPICARIAQSDVPVIIEGETGTGKEVLAESLHAASSRAQGPFVVFDCTAVPPTLMEAVLFGHERGAFTGAHVARPGVFERADGGTLLIDEIGDLDASLQPKLLRVLERSEVQRVGGTQWLRVDVRILSATRRNLEEEIQRGRFRDDLFYRLAVSRVELPPLRSRTGDVPLLALHFWKSLGGTEATFPHDFMERLDDYRWPGNIRELRNVIAHRYALGDLADIESLQRASHRSPVDTAGGRTASQQDAVARAIALKLDFTRARRHVLEDFHQRYLDWIVAQHGGNVSRAAESSGIARRYFYTLRSSSRRHVEA